MNAQNKIKARKKIFAEIQDLWLRMSLVPLWQKKNMLLSKTSPERYHQPSSRSDLLDVSKELWCDYVSFPCLAILHLARLFWLLMLWTITTLVFLLLLRATQATQ